MLDPMQEVFDGAEDAQDALAHLAGIERALSHSLEPVFARLRDPVAEQTILALVASVRCFRQAAAQQVRRMQDVSMGRAPVD